MTRTHESDLLIVGGGLAGFALAAYLRRLGREPTVAERASRWSDGGYGIGLWRDGLDVLDELGRLGGVRERATDPDGFEIRSSRAGRLARVTLPADRSLLLAVHRADLHAALRAGTPDDWVRMGTAPERIVERPDGVVVTFDDGTTETYDLVVGADGVHSAVRSLRFTDWRVRERDTYVWSLWVPRDANAHADVDIGDDMVSVWGPGSEGFVARVGDRVGFNFAARLDPATAPDPPAGDALRARAEAIGWELPALLDAARADPFFDRVREVTCETWHTDRVVLIGDAAHAVHPISGMGASLALRDARALARELAVAGSGSGDRSRSEALARFEKRRRGDVRRAKRVARFEAEVALLESAFLRRVRDGLVERTPAVDLFVRRRATDA